MIYSSLQIYKAIRSLYNSEQSLSCFNSTFYAGAGTENH